THNSENAAFKARFLRETGDSIGARDILQVAFSNNPTSYYLGDLLGQALISLGEVERAREVYAHVGGLVRDLSEHNVWTHATALSAGFVCDDPLAIEESLRNLNILRPTRG